LKFQPERNDSVNLIGRVECSAARSSVWVGASEFGHSLLVPWSGTVQAWPPTRFEALEAAHFEQLLALRPELVIFGSGQRLRFPAPALLRALIERRIGVETMDTPAACRTYNVLATEGRNVLAALLLEPIASPAG
jgi:uncharacterized protein